VPRCRGEKHHVQFHLIVSPVLRMAVHHPVVGPQVQLHRGGDLPTVVKAQSRSLEVRTAEPIPTAGRQHLQAPAVSRAQIGLVEITARPDLLQQFFRKCERAVKPLYFLNCKDPKPGAIHAGSMTAPRKLDKRGVSLRFSP
jgi:hypothetical protein